MAIEEKGRYSVLLFAGTTEGREIAEFLDETSIPSLCFVATEYGKQVLFSTTLSKQASKLTVKEGRLSEAEMEEYMFPDLLVIDATHPYAEAVTGNIKAAAGKCACRYIRVLRAGLEKAKGDEGASGIFHASTMCEAAEYLKEKNGNVLLTTGSKTLSEFTLLDNYRERIYARVLPSAFAMKSCSALDISGSHIIGMQGPFSKEMNLAMLRQYHIAYLVTKDTGAAGGLPEKLMAAKEANIRVVMIGRPKGDEGISLYECLRTLSKEFQIRRNQEISVIGIGGGSRTCLTIEAEQKVSEAELIIASSKRMLLELSIDNKEVLCAYRPDLILRHIEEHPEYKRIAVLFSGDVGFFSGAKGLYEKLNDTPLFARITIYPGISSLQLFCARLKTSWEDVTVRSLHGKQSNIVSVLRQHRRLFCILGEDMQAADICKKLLKYGMRHARISIGERLSYPDEKISVGEPADFTDYRTDDLSVILLEAGNDNAVSHNTERSESYSSITQGIPDECFIRDKVPMTKEEVRVISVSKLHLSSDAVVYDIGAGTGSVSIEMARLLDDGEIYAVEKKEEGIDLIRKNAHKFGTDNIHAVLGTAPEALVSLPSPTHAFIGGSSGNLRKICALLLHKNPSIRIVINAITLETTAEALSLFQSLPVTNLEIVQVQTARSKEVGSYHMMMGANPVTVIAFDGKGAYDE